MIRESKCRFNLSVEKTQIQLIKEMAKLDHDRSANSMLLKCVEMAIEQIPELQELAQKAKKQLEQSTDK